MIDSAPQPATISYRFVEKYQERHGHLPPNMTRTLTAEHMYLPTTELMEHLEEEKPPTWSETWGRRRFVDRGLRVAGEYEEVIAKYMQALAQEKKVTIKLVSTSRRTRAMHGLVIANHETEWGTPIAKVFWNDGGSISQINLEFSKNPEKIEF